MPVEGMPVPEGSEGGDCPLRRLYPHFTRSGAKVGSLRVAGLGRVQYAERRAKLIDELVFPCGGAHARWLALRRARWEAREMWGISPEMEFFICRVLRVRVQHWASPFTAMRGGWGRVGVRGEGWGGRGRGAGRRRTKEKMNGIGVARNRITTRSY